MSDATQVLRAELSAIRAHATAAAEQLARLHPNVGHVTVTAENVPEIAATLTSLEAENNRLRGALDEVTSVDEAEKDDKRAATRMAQIARKALERP